ncbi:MULTISPECIES: phage baseplate assembly protein V [unclassified Pseudoalteromonas]|uniref:phage baseplate assembly protein V n=1 Tax=unclassified Pseudoalteromonas TaxID=194690 RepID=UPI001F2F912D|nr:MULTISPECIES: phage baseplate assembly protein V [unclassified Pseudoalteromonas]MCF2827072.1 phage baseplate assembly protein V [Pseudoalteromonas sp. OF5H-5]MCF2832034.1 phage baseplate assembly protein V [Pseudoalteromonas sp. DL2-H6]MCF2925915.1 phage baseplate assembly protein V [Pseudoalteromonas sp. DL2-H1]
MRQLIEQIMREMLNPYLERIEDLSSEAEDLRRRTQSMIRLGRVIEVDESGWLIKVKHGELTTPFIRWFSVAAGEVREYRCPSVDEQCVLLNFGAGNNGTQTVALIGLFSDKYPSPSSDPNEILRVYPDGTKVSYNVETHKLDVVIEGEASVRVAKSATVDIGENATVKAGGKVKVDGSKIHLNGGSPCVTTAHICHFTGNPHGDGSSTVTAGK